MRVPIDLRCYVITNALRPHEVVDKAVQAAVAGAGVIQVRSKPINARELYGLACAVGEGIAKHSPRTRVLIDDRVDIAADLMAQGAHIHGVHIGQDDLPLAAARRVLGPEAIIGLTTGTMELVEGANQLADLIDYIGCGPFRATPTKDSGRDPIGLEGYPALVAASRLPLVAIGDVTPADVPDLAATGISGVALVRAVMDAANPAAVVAKVLEGFEQ